MPAPYHEKHDRYLDNYHRTGERKIIGSGRDVVGRRKNGTTFPMGLSVGEATEDGNTVFVGIIHDLTERVKSDQAIREAAMRLKTVADTAVDGLILINANGSVLMFNRACERLFGYRAEEMIGKNVKCLMPAPYHEEHDRYLDNYHRTGERKIIGIGREVVGRRSDGTTFPMGLSVGEATEGGKTVFVGIIHDLTERRRAEDRSRWNDMLIGVKDYALIVLDPEGRVTAWNEGAGRIKGYRSDEIIGEHFSKFYTPESQALGRPAEELRIAMAEGRFEDEGWRVRKDGSRFWANVIITSIHDGAGGLCGFGKVTQDITERKAAEMALLEKVTELNRSNEELGQFAYIASHDLQEPLRMVASYTQLLARRYKGKLDADADEFITFAVDGANRMQCLIQDLLAYSRIGTKGQELLEASSERALQQALVNLRDAIEESGALVTHDALPTVLADEIQLIQLFQNLVGNAIKYQKPGTPKVHISAARDGGERWNFAIKDNGLGIDPQYFEKIFGMFQRLHRRDEYAGTGIGLAICKKIVEGYGGSISVESKPGHGSTFRFALAGSDKKSRISSEETVCP
jgi:PAS domain S-box-containing protein